MAVRNHITYIRKADEVAKGTEEIEQKAKAESQKGDPKDAEKAIQDNTSDTGEVDGNGSGIKFTTAASKDAERAKSKEQAKNPVKADVKKQAENAKKAEETHVKPEDIATPATSQEENSKK